MKIAINGAGIGGPTLAYWLRRFGHEPVLIEKAPALRAGGYVVDFWGVGYDIAEKMGVIPVLEQRGYHFDEICWVDTNGRPEGRFNTEAFRQLAGGRFVSVERSDLSRSLFETVDGDVETIFGDSIAGIDHVGDFVKVSFDRAKPRDFDLVVGADGLHSRVRQIAFGPTDRFEWDLGIRVAAFEIEGYRPRTENAFMAHTVPGRFVARVSKRADRTLVLMACRDRFMRDVPLADPLDRRGAIQEAFAGVGWECPDLLRGMRDADEVYFDRASQIRMPHWTAGRVALIGDAASAVSLLAGEGSGLSMAQAYVLAGEIARSPKDLPAAFLQYEKRLMAFVAKKQESATSVASAFVPDSHAAIFVRNLVTNVLPMKLAAKFGLGSVTDDIDLPGYEAENAEERA